MYALNRWLFATLFFTTWVTVTGCGNRATKDPDFENPITLDQDSEPVLKEKKRLKGRWEVVSDSLDRKTDSTFEVSEDRVTVSDKNVTNKYRFSIDPTKTPRRIDLFFLREDDTEREIPMRGIYSLDEGRLTISVGGWGPSSGHGDPFLRADILDPAADDPKRQKWWIVVLRREE